MEWVYIYKTNETNVYTQPAFTSSKLTIETLEQGVKYVRSVKYVFGVVLVSLLLILNM